MCFILTVTFVSSIIGSIYVLCDNKLSSSTYGCACILWLPMAFVLLYADLGIFVIDGEVNGAFLLVPFLVSISLFIPIPYKKYKLEKKQRLINDVENILEKNIHWILELKEQLYKSESRNITIITLVQLITMLTNNSDLKARYYIAKNKDFETFIYAFKNIIPSKEMPCNKEQFDLYVAQQLKRESEYKAILAEIHTYDYRRLKSLYNQYKKLQ